MAGYVAYSLHKRFYKRRTTEIGKAALKVVSSWKCPKDNPTTNKGTFLEYTKGWVDEVDRGGLFMVNDEFYLFIRRVENAVRGYLNKTLMSTYHAEDLREVLMQKFNECEGIDLARSTLIPFVSKEEAT